MKGEGILQGKVKRSEMDWT